MVEACSKTIKTSLKAVEWRDQYETALKELVEKTNLVVTNVYLFARYMFVTEKHLNPSFDLRKFICPSFFSECFMSLTTRTERATTRTPSNVIDFKAIITRHKAVYLRLSGATLQDIPNAQQISLYEGKKIYTCYMNNVLQRFSKHWNRLINLVAEVKDMTPEERKLLGKFKKAAAASTPVYSSEIMACSKLSEIAEVLRTIRENYDQNYVFQKDSIYYDVKAQTINHFNAFYSLSAALAQRDFKAFQVFPLRRSFIPAHMTIDTKILYQRILSKEDRASLPPQARANPAQFKKQIWSKVLNIDNRVFQERNSTDFHGTIQTDGVSISILKANYCGFNKRTCTGERVTDFKKRETEDEPGIEQLTKPDLSRVVLIDPGRRDQLYCMGYESQPNEKNSLTKKKQIYRYTTCQRINETKQNKYRNIRNTLKTDTVEHAELMLSSYNLTTLKKNIFDEYLQARSEVADILYQHYSKPLFRKLKLSAYIRNQQSEKRLVRNLRDHFNPNPILVIGNWSADHIKYHPPQKGIGIRKMLRKEGLTVLTIDEYKTSKVCPNCLKESLCKKETFTSYHVTIKISSTIF